MGDPMRHIDLNLPAGASGEVDRGANAGAANGRNDACSEFPEAGTPPARRTIRVRVRVERPRIGPRGREGDPLNVFVVAGISALLVGLLALLQRWQQAIDDARYASVAREIGIARETGTDLAPTQFPIIDPQACIGCGSCIAACPEAGVLGLVDRIAHVIHGSRCIGHGLCAEACPVAAIRVGLGDVSARTDLPTLDARLESTVPGLFVAGELGGVGLIRNAVAEGTRVLDAIAEDLGVPRAARGARRPGSARVPRGREGDALADVLIVGSGPAGFAATLRAIELGLSYRTIDQDDIGGTVRKYPRRKLTLTGALELPLHGRVERREFLKEELIEFWEEVAARFGVVIESGVKLLGLESPRGDGEDPRKDAPVFTATTSAGTIRSRRVVLALGRRGTPRRLGVPGEEDERVFYQLLDAASFEGERILVVGGGNSAVEAATALADQRGNQVTLSYRRAEFFRLAPRNAERARSYAAQGRIDVKLSSRVVRIDGGTVELAVDEDGVDRHVLLGNDQVFVLAGGEPPYALLHGIGVGFGVGEGVPRAAEAKQRRRASVDETTGASA